MGKKKIKIKHHRYNLYNKRKSKGRQVLTVILMIILVAALCVVGYGLGKPIMEYLNGERTSQIDESSSDYQSDIIATVETDEQTAETKETSETNNEEEQNNDIFILDETAATSIQTLNTALAEAKSKGYGTVLITMKNENGQFLYKTENKFFSYEGDNIIGTLTAKEIANIVKSQGMTAYAAVSTLKDPLTGGYSTDIRYNTADGYGWLDAAVDKGGKSWLSPFADKTADFLSEITSELASAGFEKIVLRNLMYPAFKNVDYNTYLSNLPQLTDSGERANALWDIVSVCEKAAGDFGASVAVEVNSSDILEENLLGTTAEIANDKDSLKSTELLINYNPETGAAYQAATAFMSRLSASFGELIYSVSLTGFTDKQSEDIAKAFSQAQIVVFSE